MSGEGEAYFSHLIILFCYYTFSQPSKSQLFFWRVFLLLFILYLCIVNRKNWDTRMFLYKMNLEQVNHFYSALWIPYLVCSFTNSDFLFLKFGYTCRMFVPKIVVLLLPLGTWDRDRDRIWDRMLDGVNNKIEYGNTQYNRIT